MQRLIFYLFATGFLVSCFAPDREKPNNDKTPDTSKIPFTETRLGDGDYYLSIPADYSITVSNGPDFSVYYYLPKDTTIHDKLSGGLYFGFYPNEFQPSNDSCTIDSLKGKMLSNMQTWIAYHCNDGYSIQTVMGKKGSPDMDEKIHAFGHGISKEDLNTILDIFATLKKK